MEFRKIDDTKFQCRLLEEDLENNNISLDDFFRNDTVKIHGLLDTVMEEAKESIGIDMDGSVMSLQLAPQPDHSLLLTISSGKEDFNSMLKQAGSDLSNQLTKDIGKNIYKNFTDAKNHEFKSFDKISEIFNNMEEDNASKENESNNEQDIVSGEIAKPDQTETFKEDEKNSETKVSKENTRFLVGVFKFNSLEDFEEMCNRMPKTWGVTNSLWKDEDKYYFIIKRGRCNRQKYTQVLNLVVEYGKFDWAGEERVAYVEEHFTPIIKSNAINTIKRYL